MLLGNSGSYQDRGVASNLAPYRLDSTSWPDSCGDAPMTSDLLDAEDRKLLRLEESERILRTDVDELNANAHVYPYTDPRLSASRREQ